MTTLPELMDVRLRAGRRPSRAKASHRDVDELVAQMIVTISRRGSRAARGSRLAARCPRGWPAPHARARDSENSAVSVPEKKADPSSSPPMARAALSTRNRVMALVRRQARAES